MDEFIPMSRPFLDNEEIEAVTEVLKSGWITSGPKAKAFEEAFARYVDAPYALALSSGTAGMHLILKAYDIGAGDEVITPSMTFASTINQIVLAGARPVFADIEYDTLLVRPEKIEKLITRKTRAIIPVHFAGAPADLDAIRDVAGGIPIIEDAAHAIGTYYHGKHIGAKNPAVFSFHPIKNITTAEGGMLTGYDEELMQRIRLLRFHGIERDAWKRYGKASDPGYDITEPGYKYNITDIQAALGIVQMKKLQDINQRRARIAHHYLDQLSDIMGLDLPGMPPYEHLHAWHLFVVKVNSMERRNFMEALAENNVGYGLHFPACHRLDYVQRLFGKTDLPVTEDTAAKIISLPLYPGMNDSQTQRVINVVRGILG
ncbi:MAG: aminotransferase class I/II-fold pyridoxal phosphate-dependent enzyme [Deltaproteobacteria bacterium]|nr:aminotransferase class I/II-fold pyridoxal phosphate-dependent enzyme [Deltaproteobacteria bacterium]